MKPLMKKCIVCGTQFTKPYWSSRSQWGERKFCSRKCINKGRVPINKKLFSPLTCGNCKKLFKADRIRRKYCCLKCARAKQIFPKDIGRKRAETRKRNGYKHSLETRMKIAKANIGRKSHFWKGGISEENHRIRQTAEYREWRTKVFKRDNHTCQICKKRGRRLQADHIKQFALFPKLRFKLSNGRTLCVECHKQTDTYAKNLKISS